MTEHEIHVTLHVRAPNRDDAEALVTVFIEEQAWASDDGDDEGVVGYRLEEDA